MITLQRAAPWFLLACFVLMAYSASMLLFCYYMLNRNGWVRKMRLKILYEQGVEEYEKYVDYDAMLNRWWEWDVEKFRRG